MVVVVEEETDYGEEKWKEPAEGGVGEEFLYPKTG